MFGLSSIRYAFKIKRGFTYSSRSLKVLHYGNCLLRSYSSKEEFSANGCKYKPFSGKVDQIKTLHSEDDHFVKVTWKSGKQSRFPYIFLRENCKCPSCFHPRVKQRLVVVYNEKSVADSITIKDNGNYLECCWSDGHVSYYSAKWLNHRCFVEKSDKVKSYEETSILKDGCELLSAEYNLREMAYDYEAIMSDDKSLLHWSYDLHCRGLTLIQNAPAKEGVLFKLAERVGHYKLTVHGHSFFVKDKSEDSLAYTNKFLEVHSDLPHNINPPDIQCLHGIEVKTEGGTNSFVDGFKIALSIKEKSSKVFDILSSTLVPHHDDSVGPFGEFVFDQSRPIIKLNDRGQLDKIYFANLTWADYFDDLSPEEVVAFYEAKAMFAEYFHAEDFIIRHLLRPGEIVFFDNNRVLHGRDAFTEKEGGGRVLEGMYFDWDPFVSKIKVLNRKLGYPFPFKYHTPPHFS